MIRGSGWRAAIVIVMAAFASGSHTAAAWRAPRQSGQTCIAIVLPSVHALGPTRDKRKATADGEDLLTPLVEKSADTIVGTLVKK